MQKIKVFTARSVRFWLAGTAAFGLLLTGCAFNPSTTRNIVLAPAASNDAVFDAAIDAARQVGFPPMTKMDKTNGVIEFGGFGTPELGTSAQVRIRSDHQADITVKRGSVYVPLGTDSQADKFKAAFEEHLKAKGLVS